MKHTILVVTVLALLLTFLSPLPLQAAKKAITVKMDKGRTEITYLEGGAFLVRKDLTKIRPLVQGEFLTPGDHILTEKHSRIELKLPDDSFVRFDERTNFVLSASEINKKKKTRKVRFRMFLGKVWANVSKRFGRKGRFMISSRTAVAGVRGTVYRMNVNADDSVTVKVYSGEVDVSGKAPAADSQAQLQKPSEKEGRHPIAGPTPIAGPRPVSVEEWTMIVGAMQQINISPDGRPSKPFKFDRDKDLDQWVLFNKKRDKKLKIEDR